MHQATLILVVSFMASTLAACGNAPLAPSTEKGGVGLKQEPSPTVATNMGPFEQGSGCTQELSGNYGSVALDVNADGVVVGHSSCVASETLSFRWSELEGMEQLAHFSGGYPIFGAESINESGTIAAIFFPFSPPVLAARPVLWTAANSRIELVSATECESYQELPCSEIWGAHFINDKDVVAGNYIDGAYRWTAATGLVDLPALDAHFVVGINSQGDIIARGGGSAALLRKSGKLVDISGIGPTGINNKREIVGGALNGPDVNAAMWSQGRGVELLGTLGGTHSVAYDINDKSEVVGTSTNAAGETRAFYWTRAHGMVDLGPGIAYAISESGHMVGTAPTGIFPPDTGVELWQAVLWRGTAGVEAAAVAAREIGVPVSRGSECFAEAQTWQSKYRMFRCVAGG